jgi:hypothetical protein
MKHGRATLGDTIMTTKRKPVLPALSFPHHVTADAAATLATAYVAYRDALATAEAKRRAFDNLYRHATEG